MLALSVVVLATVVSAKVEVNVLCSVVTGSVGTVVLCAVVPWSTCVDSENVVEWTDVLDLLLVELGSRVVLAEEYSVDCPVEYPSEVLTSVLRAGSVEDAAEDNPGVLVCSVVVLATVVSSRVDVAVLRSVVAGTVRKVVLCVVLL